MIILAIDIGIENLGLVAASLNPNFTINTITHCKLINLTRNCNKRGCTLHHSNTITDRMIHFFTQYKDILDSADTILIERQIPTSGLVAIQSLIHFQYRQKSILVSPNSMHAFYGISHLDYERRKRATITLAKHSLMDQKEFVFNEKKDDIADAWCYVNQWSRNKHNEYEEQRIKEEWRQKNKKFIEDIDRFRYTPEVDSLTSTMNNMEIN